MTEWRATVPVLLVLTLSAAGCGGDGDAGADEQYEEEASSGDESAPEPNDGAQITGLMGTIRADQVRDALEPRMPRFQRCFSDRMRAVELLAGRIRMGFRVHTDGTVLWVFPQETDIGDRDTERCILDIARTTRFPRPRGGEAEFGWGFEFDPDLPRPADPVGEGGLGRRASDLPTVARTCRARGSHTITAYVRPGGTVVAAGGTAPDAESDEALDCILEAVRGWTVADPGSYTAKLTFGIR